MSNVDRKQALSECMNILFERIGECEDRENLYGHLGDLYLVLTNEEADVFFEDYVNDPLTDKLQLLPESVRSAEYPANNWRDYAHAAGRSFFLGDDGVEMMCRISDVAYYIYRVGKLDPRDYGQKASDPLYVIRPMLYKYHDNGVLGHKVWDCSQSLNGWRMSAREARKDYLRARDEADKHIRRINQTMKWLQDFGEFEFRIDKLRQKVCVEVYQDSFSFRKSLNGVSFR